MAKNTDVYVSDVELRRTRRARIARYVFMIFLGYGIVLFSTWTLLYSRAFRVSDIRIEGVNEISSEDVLEVLHIASFSHYRFLKSLLGYRNILVWPETMNAEDLVFLPKVERMDIEKNYRTGIITVRVVERTPRGIWCFAKDTPTECFWFDKDGVLYERAFGGEGNLVHTVTDLTRTRLPLRATILESHLLSPMLSVLRALQESEVGVKELRLEDRGLQEIKAFTYAGPEIRFSLRFSAENTAGVLSSFVKTQELSKLRSIDFTAESRVYYK